MSKKVKIKTKRVITLSDDKKTRLDIGVHDIDEEQFNHWFIQGLIAVGDVKLVGKQSDKLSVLPESHQVKVFSPVAKSKITKLPKVGSKLKKEEEPVEEKKRVPRVKKSKTEDVESKT